MRSIGLESMQVAFVAGNTYTFVEVLAAMLFLATQSDTYAGYYPSNAMVRFSMLSIVRLHLVVSDQAALLVQQLYIFGGLLISYACVNTFPLKALNHLTWIGAVWQVAG